MRWQLIFHPVSFLFLIAIATTGNSVFAETHSPLPLRKDIEWSNGAIVRGSQAEKKIALVFRGSYFDNDVTFVLDGLREQHVKASFFLYGAFLKRYPDMVKKMLADGHYVGPHTETHPFYVSRDSNKKTIITKAELTKDLEKNLQNLVQLGARREDMRFMVPPHGAYNEEVSQWIYDEFGIRLVDASRGTFAESDWMLPDDPRGGYHTSEQIVSSVLDFERQSSHGLNGFLLRFYVSVHPDQKDRVTRKISDLVKDLIKRGYRFVRVDEIFKAPN